MFEKVKGMALLKGVNYSRKCYLCTFYSFFSSNGHEFDINIYPLHARHVPVLVFGYDIGIESRY